MFTKKTALKCGRLNPFTTGNPFLGTKLLGFSIGRGSGALKGLRGRHDANQKNRALRNISYYGSDRFPRYLPVALVSALCFGVSRWRCFFLSRRFDGAAFVV